MYCTCPIFCGVWISPAVDNLAPGENRHFIVCKLKAAVAYDAGYRLVNYHAFGLLEVQICPFGSRVFSVGQEQHIAKV